MKIKLIALALIALNFTAFCNDLPLGDYLEEAAKQGDLKKVESIIAQPEYTNRDGYVTLALMYAAQQKHVDIVDAIIKSESKKTGKPHKNSALLISALNCYTNAVKKLISPEVGADIEFLDGTGVTALAFAARKNCTETVQALLNAGAVITDEALAEETTDEIKKMLIDEQQRRKPPKSERLTMQ